MTQFVASAEGLAEPLGPYTFAARTAAGLVFVSGQIPQDGATGTLETGSISAQTALVLDNMQRVLRAIGLTLDHVISCMIYLTDLGEFQEMNRVYGERFGSHRPARATVGVASLFGGVRVEISAIAEEPPATET